MGENNTQSRHTLQTNYCPPYKNLDGVAIPYLILGPYCTQKGGRKEGPYPSGHGYKGILHNVH